MKSLRYRFKGKPRTLSDWIDKTKKEKGVRVELRLSIETRVDTYGLFYDFTAHLAFSGPGEHGCDTFSLVCSTVSTDCTEHAMRQAAKIADHRLGRTLKRLDGVDIPVSGVPASFLLIPA